MLGNAADVREMRIKHSKVTHGMMASDSINAAMMSHIPGYVSNLILIIEIQKDRAPGALQRI